MKLKLTTKPTGADGAPAATPTSEVPPSTPASTTSASAPKLKFKMSAPAAPTIDGASAELPKPKRKYTKKPKVDEDGSAIAPKSKKRARDGNPDEGSPPAKRKPKPTAKSMAMIHNSDDEEEEHGVRAAPQVVAPRPPVRQGSMLKIKMKPNAPNGNGLQRTGTIGLKIKGYHGKPPVRPPGVGFDSEAEEAEEDPAIESQFVLRMQPGPDCDLLRKAVEEKTAGRSIHQGGTGVQFRFFDKEGRRATVNIQGRLYAACMVDLPCILESMKSWNKKDWVKTADVCQMLLVLGRVQSEDEAKKYPLPREVDHATHLYAHGLTPPMHYVRKRRFRPRASYHRIEDVEKKVNALLIADAAASEGGGSSEFSIIDENRVYSSDESTDEGDAEGYDADEPMLDTTEMVLEAETPGGEQVEIDMGDMGDMADNDDLEKALAAGLMEDDDLFGDDTQLEPETPATAHDVAMHALGENAAPETAASTPEQVTSPDDDDDDDDDADSPAVAQADGKDPAEKEDADMSQIQELLDSIADLEAQFHSNNNQIFKKRTLKKLEELRNELKIQKSRMGLPADED